MNKVRHPGCGLELASYLAGFDGAELLFMREQSVSSLMRILRENDHVRTAVHVLRRMFVLNDNHLHVVGQPEQVVIEAIFQIGPTQIVFLPLRFPVRKKRRVQNHEARVGEVVFPALDHEPNRHRRMRDRSQSFAGAAALFARNLDIAFTFIEKDPRGIRVIPLGQNLFDRFREVVQHAF